MDYRYRMSPKELEYTYEHAQRRMKEHPSFAEEHKAVIEKHPFFNSEKEALEKVLELNKEKHSNYQIWAKMEKGKDNIYRIQNWWLVTNDGKIKMSAEYIGMALMYDDIRLSEIFHMLHHCRYYKGEKENPFEGTKGMLWQWEKTWFFNLTRDSEEDKAYMSKILEDYILAGLRGFEKFDNTPVTLKALLYNRFDHWNEAEGFESFYRKYYPSKKEMKDNYLLHHCRYYKGEEECPFTQIDDRFTAWKIEAMWVNMMVNDSEHLNFCLEEYLLRGMKDFQKYDDTPITLKALLMNRYFKYEEREDIEGFKKFYREFYGKSK